MKEQNFHDITEQHNWRRWFSLCNTTKMRKILKSQIVNYGIVGVISTSIHICIASLFVAFVYNSLMAANVVAFGFAFIFSYFAQSRFVFKNSVTFKKAVKFFIVQVASLMLAIKTAEFAESIPIYFKIFIVAIILPICAFIIHRVWTFVDHGES